MFAILTAGDFLQKLQDDYAAVKLDIANAGKIINAILAAYHIHEWVWARWLKAIAPKSIRGTMIRRDKDFIAFLDRSCPHFSLIQDLANGSKHCSPVHSTTDKIAGYGLGPYGIGPFGAPYLLVDLGEDRPAADRYLVASEVLGEVVQFWTAFFQEHGIP